jgi:hypothetical protein
MTGNLTFTARNQTRQHIIKANTIDTLKFLNDESFELRDRFPDDVACMANAMLLKRIRVMSLIR